MTRAFAIIEMSGGVPAIDFELTPLSGGYCLGAHHAGYGMYMLAGTTVELTAINALANVWRICTLAEIDNVISATRRNRINNWLSDRGWPTVPAGWTFRQVILYAYQRANPNYDHDRFYLKDI